MNLVLTHGSGYISWPANPRDPPVSASPVLGLKACTTKPSFLTYILGILGSGLHICKGLRHLPSPRCYFPSPLPMNVCLVHCTEVISQSQCCSDPSEAHYFLRDESSIRCYVSSSSPTLTSRSQIFVLSFPHLCYDGGGGVSTAACNSGCRLQPSCSTVSIMPILQRQN